MGYNTVAVLYNDFTGDLRRDGGRYAERIADAMQAYGIGSERHKPRLNFGAGVVISQAHADGEQVVIVSRNFGYRADEAEGLGWMALDQMQRCLERHGYKVTKPKRKKPAARSTEEGE